MAEIVLGSVGGIASVAHIIELLAKLTIGVANFCREVPDSPRVSRRVRNHITLLQQHLENVQSRPGELEDDSILPAATSCNEAAIAAGASFDSGEGHLKKSPGTGKRILWVLKDKPALKRVQTELEELDWLVSSILTFANFDISLSHYQAFLAAKAERESKNESPDAAATSRPLPFRDSQLHQVPGGPFQYMVLGMGPMLRRLGFYGEITTKSSREHFFAASIYLGYKLPTWLWARSFDVEFRISVPRLIRLQRRIPLNSPFLNACRNGDVWKIRQHLCDGVGFVGDRAMCNGVTPLLLAIEGGHVDSIAYLLGAGADPNIGDDDRVLPVFSALGMNPRKSRYFPQFAPTRDTWLDVLHLLVDHGASIHEVVAGRSLAMLDIIPSSTRPRTLEFFRFLQNELYADFPTTDLKYASPFVNAIRSADSAIECLEFLKKHAGVDFSRLAADDGRTVLHFGAEFAADTRVLDYLCASCDPSYVNRQDVRGWTPLHYAVSRDFFNNSAASLGCGQSLMNVQYLVRRGEDPTLRSTARFPALCDGLLEQDMEEFSPLELCKAFDATERGRGRPKYERLVGILEEFGHGVSETEEGSVFFDALEFCPLE